MRRGAGGVRGLLAAAGRVRRDARATSCSACGRASFELDGPWTDPELPRIEVEAELVEALGDEALVSFRVDAPAVAGRGGRAPTRGGCSPTTRGTRFVARVRGRVDVRTGERLELAVDHRELHLFDPASGAALDVDHAHVSG